MDPAGKGLKQAGKVLGIAGTILFIFEMIALFAYIVLIVVLIASN